MGSVQQARQATKSLGTVAPYVILSYRSRQFRCRYCYAKVASEAKAHLLVFTPDAKENGNEGVKAYLESGEAADIDKGYKTSIRDQWLVIPSIKLSDALFLRRNNLYPKFVLNEAGAYTTDTMHRVFIKEGVNKKAFVDYKKVKLEIWRTFTDTTMEKIMNM